MVARKSKAFTLIELLVVVAIIILLVSILTPALGRVLEHSRRSACAANVREIARAVRTYTLTSNLHRGAKAKSFPDIGPDTNNWPAANRACLWLLVRHGYISPETFICPSLDGFTAAKSTASDFANDNCGYSFITMVEQARTLNNTDNALVIVADLNPRFNPGSSTVYDYADLDHSGGVDSAEQKLADELDADGKLKNSATHGHDGQNVARLEGSAEFLRKGYVATGSNNHDWIYESTEPQNDNDGKSRGGEDVLLLN
jgi:prepilin-type N-terminal cleavage/methylation domain-containing protein